MFMMSWRLALFSLIPVPIVVFVGKRFGKVLGPKYMRMWRRSASISSMLADTIPSVRVIKAFTNERKTVKRFNAYCDEWFKEDKKAAVPSAVFPSVITFLVTCGTLVIWFMGGNLVISGSSEVSLGLLVSFISYASMFYNPVNFFANIGDTYQNTLASAERYSISSMPSPSTISVREKSSSAWMARLNSRMSTSRSTARKSPLKHKSDYRAGRYSRHSRNDGLRQIDADKPVDALL